LSRHWCPPPGELNNVIMTGHRPSPAGRGAPGTAGGAPVHLAAALLSALLLLALLAAPAAGFGAVELFNDAA